MKFSSGILNRTASVLLFCGIACQAPAAVFTNLQEFLNANPTLSLVDFEGIAPARDSVRLPQPQQGVTFQGSSFTGFDPNLVSVADSPNNDLLIPSDVAFVNFTQGYVMRINLGTLYANTGLRLKIGRDGSPARVRAYSNGTLVADQTFATASGFTTFIGFSEAVGIDFLEVAAVTQTPGNFVQIDDLRFGMPVVDTSDVPIPLEWKSVGNAGNPADSTGFGSVSYNYRIAKHEVTNAQYVEFLNAVAASDPHGLFNLATVPDPRAGVARTGTSGNYQYTTRKNLANKPAIWYSFYDALRMANWMHNGKGNGSTETGAYDMSLAMPVRLPGAKYFIPTEDEWYKAAYYDPTPGSGGGDNYWLYPTRSNSLPAQAVTNGSGTISNPGPNIANYFSGASWAGLLGHLTTVGSAGPASDSYYGTADQGGNIMEFNETIILATRRGIRGGGWSTHGENMAATLRDYNDPTVEGLAGIRLAAAAPEVSLSIPATASILEDAGGAIEVVVSRTAETDAPLEVNLAMAGQAAAGTDYALNFSAGKVVIPAGSSTASILIDPVADNLDETDESVVITLLPGETYNRAAAREASALILDDDFTPIAVADTGYEVVEDGALLVSAASGVLANDTDQDDGGGPANLTAELIGNAAHGLLSLNPDGSFSYTPQADYFGPDSFTYRASDGINRSAVATVSLVVTELVDLRMTSLSDAAVIGAPDTSVHTLTLQNLGPSDASSVVIALQSVLPAGVSRDSIVASAGVIAGDQWTLDLAEEGTATVSVSYSVSAAAAGGIANLVTRASVSSLGQPRTALEDDATEVASSILSPANVGLARLDVAPLLNRQSGLFLQQVTVTNNNPLPMAGFRLLIGNLPADVQVHNRQGIAPGGQPYVDQGMVLPPGGQVTLTIEFFRPGRGAEINPTFTVAAVYAEPPAEAQPATAGSEPNRIAVLAGGDVLVEFSSIPGANYAIEYSPNLSVWHRVVPSVRAAANRTQWIDAGPPKTSSHPSSVAARYYRIVDLPE